MNRYNNRTKSYQDEVPEAVRAVASSSVVQGPYDAMGSGDALAVRKLIEQHRNKMLTIRRRDFEVVNMLLESHTIFLWSTNGNILSGNFIV